MYAGLAQEEAQFKKKIFSSFVTMNPQEVETTTRALRMMMAVSNLLGVSQGS